MSKVQGSWKKKLEYFWMYYKIPFLVTLFLSAAVLYFAHAKLTEKPFALQAILYDIHADVTEEEMQASFAAYAGIDTGKYDVSISTSLLLSDAASGNYALASLSKFMTLIGTEDLDVCMMLESDFKRYETSAFMDLRELFTEEELAEFSEPYTDGEGRICGIYSRGLPRIETTGGYSGSPGVVGVIYNSNRKEMAAEFLRYLNSQE